MVCILTVFACISSALIVTGHMALNDNRDVVNVANYVMNFHNSMSNYTYAFKVVKVLSDAAQLYPPARVKYTLQIEAAQTVCKNQENVNITQCAFQDNAETMTCSFSVIAVPGNNYIPKRVLSHQCG
ncbi:cystatin-F [Danio aesculapii]|uniref:cystatin-F n=1 Tax=Danio aesculapii TaxID=1142201 RepID=UPI0024C00BA0|nr:cystatin-F [Danio aesculapii]